MLTAATVLAEGRHVPLRRIVKQLAFNPLLVAIVGSALVRVAAVPVPAALKAIIDMLGNAATPCSLVAMGIALCRYGMGGKPALAAILTGLKIVVHPLIVYLLATRVFAMPAVWSGVAVLFAAAPSGVNAYLFAERYRAGITVASSTIALSTGLSVLSTAFWLLVLGKG
jgi:predicted permease